MKHNFWMLKYNTKTQLMRLFLLWAAKIEQSIRAQSRKRAIKDLIKAEQDAKNGVYLSESTMEFLREQARG